jgi:uncharacterized lipoprotein YddW (UPF0748 family)
MDVERETRAVWLTTNFQLDWPPKTFDENVQRINLEAIFQDLSTRNFNTIYFQVRSNGVVIYNSGIEPFSPYFTNEVGVPPSYDPLQYAIELGRKYNIEVHAWINMIRCFSGSDEKVLKHPKHIRNSHPEWTVRVMDEDGSLSYWLNPGYHKVQDYLVNLLIELTSKYDVDGIHLDFFRYPSKYFDDEKLFNQIKPSISREEWRRNNLTSILRKFKEKVIPRNPFLKVGATPIGISKNLNGAIGWEGYSEVFQDTETWLKEELVDYLTPQIYWDLNKNPRFEVLANDWIKKSNNKNIVLGLAAYKDDVKPELNEMITISRKIGAAGVSFFRYENINSKSDKYFNSIAFPKNMEWKELKSNYTNNKIFSKYAVLSDEEIIINWIDSNGKELKGYRAFALLNDDKPIKLFSLDKTNVKLKFGFPTKLRYDYKITKLNRLWNDKIKSNNIEVKVPFLEKIKNDSKQNSNLILYKMDEVSALIAITSDQNQKALIDIINKENLRYQKLTDLKLGVNLYQVDESIKTLKKIIVTYASNNKQEELNFY